MTDYKLTREEQETICRTSAADKHWELYTADPKFIRRFDRLGYLKTETNDHGGCFYEVPSHAVRFGKPEKRKLTEKQAEALARARLLSQKTLCVPHN